MIETEFKPERLAQYMKISKKLLTDAQFSTGLDYDDFMYGIVSAKFDAYFFSNMADERTLTYYCPRPTFFDWLFRRVRKVEWTLKVKDLLLNPPKIADKTLRIYTIDKNDEL